MALTRSCYARTSSVTVREEPFITALTAYKRATPRCHQARESGQRSYAAQEICSEKQTTSAHNAVRAPYQLTVW